MYGDINVNGVDSITESPTRLVLKAPAGTKFNTGDITEVYFDLKNIHLFDAETEQTLRVDK